MDTIKVDDVQRMAKMISDLSSGITALAIVFVVFMVLMSVGIGIFLKLINDQRKQNGDMHTANEARFNEMFDMIINGKGENDIFKKSLAVSAAAEEQLKYTCGMTRCDRVAIYVFHNGVRMLNGAHLLKTSCLIEYAPLNQYCYISQSKDIPINQVLEVCTSIEEMGSYTCWDVDSMDDNSSLKSWFQDRHIKSIVACAIYDGKGQPMGFACTEFMLEEAPPEHQEHIFDQTKTLADRMVMAMGLDLL